MLLSGEVSSNCSEFNVYISKTCVDSKICFNDDEAVFLHFTFQSNKLKCIENQQITIRNKIRGKKVGKIEVCL